MRAGQVQTVASRSEKMQLIKDIYSNHTQTTLYDNDKISTFLWIADKSQQKYNTMIRLIKSKGDNISIWDFLCDLYTDNFFKPNPSYQFDIFNYEDNEYHANIYLLEDLHRVTLPVTARSAPSKIDFRTRRSQN